MAKPDPTKTDEVYGADLSGTLIAIYPVTNETVCQTSLTMKEEKYLKLETDPALIPKEGTAVNLYTLTNAKGMKVAITNYGATVVSIVVPSRNGKFGDVVLGFDSL